MRLWLAPHHDDVLISLAGYLLSGPAADGGHVAVVFSQESRELEEACTRLHLRLGLGLHLLGFEEAVRRGVSLRDCFRTARTVREAEGDALVRPLRERLGVLISSLNPRAIYSPLLPVHFDHALVRAAAEGLREVTLRYYEDQPYASLYPQVLARTRSGLVRVEVADGASYTEVETVFEELRGAVPARHLNRILVGYRTSAAPTHTFWRRPGQ